MTFEIIQTFNI